MKELKRTLKLYKYAYNFKVNVVCAIIFLAGGFFMLCLFSDGMSSSMFFLPTLYFVIAPMTMVNMIYVLEVAGLVSSSGNKGFFEKNFMDVMQIIYSMIAYLIIVVSVVIYVKRGVSAARFADGVLISGITIAVIIVYSSLAVKKPVLGLATFGLGYIGISFYGLGHLFSDSKNAISLNNAFILGFIIVLFGDVIAMVLRRLLYKQSIKINQRFMTQKMI